MCFCRYVTQCTCNVIFWVVDEELRCAFRAEVDGNPYVLVDVVACVWRRECAEFCEQRGINRQTKKVFGFASVVFSLVPLVLLLLLSLLPLLLPSLVLRSFALSVILL